MKAACVIGIDSYSNFRPLSSCVADAQAIAGRLRDHYGPQPNPNFDVELLTSNAEEVRAKTIRAALQRLFSSNATTVLFYFAGHGYVDAASGTGSIVSYEGQLGAPGITFSEILQYASNANASIRSTVIILDCCNSGGIGALPVGAAAAQPDNALIKTGVTILTAARSDEDAMEIGGQGVFTRLLLTGLDGAAADLRGIVTPASLYAHIDQSLGPFEQRPVFKANVRDFVEIRRVEPMVPLPVLRALPLYFAEPDTLYPLGPNCEPDRDTYTEQYQDIAVDPDQRKIYRNLQSCNRAGLVVPVDAEHMWVAAMKQTGCRLTELGKHYRRLAARNRI